MALASPPSEQPPRLELGPSLEEYATSGEAISGEVLSGGRWGWVGRLVWLVWLVGFQGLVER